MSGRFWMSCIRKTIRLYEVSCVGEERGGKKSTLSHTHTEEFIKLKREVMRKTREEKKYIRMVMAVREKLNDSNLALMHKTMRSVLRYVCVYVCV